MDVEGKGCINVGSITKMALAWIVGIVLAGGAEAQPDTTWVTRTLCANNSLLLSVNEIDNWPNSTPFVNLNWRTTCEPASGWQESGFDDSNWEIPSRHSNCNEIAGQAHYCSGSDLWMWPISACQQAFFRVAFNAVAGQDLTISYGVDDVSDVYINGQHIHSGIAWEICYHLDISPFLVEGENVIAIRGYDMGGCRGFWGAFTSEPHSIWEDGTLGPDRWVTSPGIYTVTTIGLEEVKVIVFQVDSDSMVGCTDAVACNFFQDATCDDGSCIYPVSPVTDCAFGEAFCSPGMIWNSGLQKCQFPADYDMTICGPGTVWDAALGICTSGLTPADCPTDLNSDGITGTEDLLMLLSQFAMDCPVPPVLEGPCAGATAVTYHDHTYPLIAIGSQCWFQENLRTASYLNGDPIPGGLSDAEWTTTTAGAQAVYNEDPANLAAYGRLYNWYAVNDARGLCPTGWHVPTEAEWTVLENELGGAQVAGAAMKSSQSDNPPWDGSNESGFKGVPGGYRSSGSGVCIFSGTSGHWWSATSIGLSAWNFDIEIGANRLRRDPDDNGKSGESVRCIMN